MNKIRVGISIGDINGIGLEVVLKTFLDTRMLELCTPVLYGSSKIVSYHKNIIPEAELEFQGITSADQIEDDAIYVVNCWNDNVKITLGKITEAGGHYAHISLDRATDDLQAGLLDVLVTAPIHKKAMQLAQFPYPGHTEFLTEKMASKDSLMFMVHDKVRVGLVTNHVPLHEVTPLITKDRILHKINMMHKTLQMDFGIEHPKIAVLGLNPHAGDEGAIGQEEIQEIIPAIEAAKATGKIVLGPYPADGFWGSSNFTHFDAVLAMYHDQGLVPFKLLSFGSGVNYTAGLPFVRTSPDHGTAYNIAGQNQASPDSFRRALFMALDIFKQRALYQEITANPLKPQQKRRRNDVDEDPSALPDGDAPKA